MTADLNKKSKKPREDKLLFRPFRRLGNILSQEFLSSAEELLFLVRSHGISKVPTPLTSREQYLKFCAQVHDGWKQAQLRIAELLVDALQRRETVAAQVTESHQRRDKVGKTAAQAKVAVVDIEITILRRILDVALWTICAGDHSMMRRFFVAGGGSNFSTKNIQTAMSAAAAYNSDPHKIALSTDILSYVHIGDLLVSDCKTGQVTFVEIKEGEKNQAIAEAVKFALESGCELFEHLTTEQLSATDLSHYNRTKRQAVRNQTIIETVRNEGGVDQNTGAIVSVLKTDDPPDLWVGNIMSCYEKLGSDKPWSIASIDECVHLGVYNDPKMAFVGFNAWMDRIKCESEILNLTDSFFDPSVRPLGATFLSIELQNKILRGEVLVIICLDYERLFEMANKLQAGFMGLASNKDTQESRRHKFRMLEHKGRAIEMRVGGNVRMLGAGFRDRVVFDQQRPSQIVASYIASMLSEAPDQKVD